MVCGEINRSLFERRDKLAWIQTWGAGVDGQLYQELVESNVILCSAKGTVGVHLADHAMALLLGLTRGLHTAIRNPSWETRWPIRDSSWELIDRTMGIVGMGGTGSELARRASAFGMRVVAVDPEEVEVPSEVEACWKMEKIVDEKSLVDALTRDKIGGAGLDVVPQEPLPIDHPLWEMDNVLITPHTAGGSPNRNERCVALFCANLRRYLDCLPLLSVVDKLKGY